MVELKKNKSGWVKVHDLYNEKIITDTDKYQIYTRLRKEIQPYLLEKKGDKFVENDKSKNYRISTHPDLITYDKEKLLASEDARIRELAQELP